MRLIATAVAARPNVPQLVALPPWLVKVLALMATKLRVAFALIAPAAVLRVSTMRHGWLRNCRLAVEHFRTAQGITDAIVPVDWTGAYWRKGADAGASADRALPIGDPTSRISTTRRR